MRERRGCVESVDEVAPATFLIAIRAIEPAAIEPLAGQFVSVRIDPSGRRRSYSIVSAPGRTDRFELVVKAAPGGGSAAFTAGLAAGAPLDYFGPMGYFLYEPHPGEVVFAATGVGITPLLPMIAAAVAAPSPPARMELLWGVQSAADRILEERLRSIAAACPRFRYRVFVEDEGDGFLTEPLVALAVDLADPRFYLCGNEAMLVDVLSRLASRGIDVGHRAYTEVFFPSPGARQL
jgi:ferredoxin-NADP reductase